MIRRSGSRGLRTCETYELFCSNRLVLVFDGARRKKLCTKSKYLFCVSAEEMKRRREFFKENPTAGEYTASVLCLPLSSLSGIWPFNTT